MPRARQTQPIRTPTGMPYGAHTGADQAQAQMPLPENTLTDPGGAGPVTAVPPGPETTDPALTQPTTPDPMQAAELMAPPPPGGLLAAETMRPNEPVTEGLPIGPGRGPEAVDPMLPRRGQEVFAEWAAITGDPMWLTLAQQMRGRA